MMVFEGSSRAYEVEFPDERGGNLGKALSYTLAEEFLGRINEPDR